MSKAGPAQRAHRRALRRERSCGAKRGEVAVFTLMMLMMSAVLVFTAVEGARIAASAFYLRMALEAAAGSAFGEFCLPLWEEYRLLFFYEEMPLSLSLIHI